MHGFSGKAAIATNAELDKVASCKVELDASKKDSTATVGIHFWNYYAIVVRSFPLRVRLSWGGFVCVSFNGSYWLKLTPPRGTLCLLCEGTNCNCRFPP